MPFCSSFLLLAYYSVAQNLSFAVPPRVLLIFRIKQGHSRRHAPHFCHINIFNFRSRLIVCSHRPAFFNPLLLRRIDRTLHSALISRRTADRISDQRCFPEIQEYPALTEALLPLLPLSSPPLLPLPLFSPLLLPLSYFQEPPCHRKYRTCSHIVSGFHTSRNNR